MFQKALICNVQVKAKVGIKQYEFDTSVFCTNIYKSFNILMTF